MGKRNGVGPVLAGIGLLMGRAAWRRRRHAQLAETLFHGKVTIVTGGASGIGRALCTALAQRGARVIVADINGEGAETAAEVLRESGGPATAVLLDVTDAAAVGQVVDEVVAENGRLDYMFNNAGFAIAGETYDMTLEQWQRIIDVNLWGVIYGTQAAYDVMRRQRSGHIVNTASAAGLVPLPYATAYATTKHAVVGLSTSLRVEAESYGVRVSAACPGFIDTALYDNAVYVSQPKEEAMRNTETLPRGSAAACAESILRGVAANRGIIPVTGMAHGFWALQRLNPEWLTPLLRQLTPERPG